MTGTIGQVRLFSTLTAEEQKAAERIALNELLEAITEGAVRFNDALNGDDTQARIDAAGEEAERMATPWFWSEYILEDETLAETLRGMARCDAEDALYPVAGVRIIRLPETASVSA